MNASSSSSSRCVALLLPAAAVQELLLLALQVQSWHAVQSLCKCRSAQQLTQADATALLQQAVRVVTGSCRSSVSDPGARKAEAAAVCDALCSLPAVRRLNCEGLASVLQIAVSVNSISSCVLVKSLNRLAAAKQLSRGVVDGLQVAAGSAEMLEALLALCALHDV
jgi:hypothetical protein